MPILGGSPLGLIQVESRPTRDGMSTFNGGRSRNVNVNLYNAGKEADKEKIVKTKQPKGSDKGGAFSLFTGASFIKPWANIQYANGANPIPKINTDGYTGVSRRTLHNNDVYDTSILNIIEKTSGTMARLRPTDFAYLKNLGVYPNNRLVIARRFSSPQQDDIFISGNSPLAILITWRTPDEDFLEISFGEKWADAKASFTELLNNITTDLLGGKKASSIIGGLGAIPLPGWSEALQRQVLNSLGIVDGNFSSPAGDPNLIKEAKRRDTVPYGEAGSGLKCTVNVKMIVEYEQKFISGIDPTIAYQDLIQNALRFSTSVSRDWGLTGNAAKTLMRWVNDPGAMVSEIASAIEGALEKAKEEVLAALQLEIDEASDNDPNAPAEPEDGESEKEQLTKTKDKIEKVLKKVIKAMTGSLKETIRKYREEVYGIAKALSGLPSTPWHVTIGNPLRPIFCAGDLYMSDNMNLTLGSTLAFNDLPSSIKLDFILTNARPWGLQEIFAKFNTGNLRQVNTINDASSLPGNEKLSDGTYNQKIDNSKPNPEKPQATDVTPNNNPVTGNPGQSVNIASNPLWETGQLQNSQTREGNLNLAVNTNPNSTQGAVSPNSDVLTKTAVNPQENGVVPTKQGTGADLANQTNVNDADPVTNANANSARGYTYTYEFIQDQQANTSNSETTVPVHRVIVKDKDGNIVLTTPWEMTGNPLAERKEKLIEDAKKAANDF